MRRVEYLSPCCRVGLPVTSDADGTASLCSSTLGPVGLTREVAGLRTLLLRDRPVRAHESSELTCQVHWVSRPHKRASRHEIIPSIVLSESSNFRQIPWFV